MEWFDASVALQLLMFWTRNLQSLRMETEGQSSCDLTKRRRLSTHHFQSEIIIIIMVIFQCYFSGELIALT